MLQTESSRASTNVIAINNSYSLLLPLDLEADFLRFSFVVNSQASDSKILFLS